MPKYIRIVVNVAAGQLRTQINAGMAKRIAATVAAIFAIEIRHIRIRLSTEHQDMIQATAIQAH